MSDWTRSETVSPPDQIVIKYKNTLPNGTTEEKEVSLSSSTRSVSASTYQNIGYTDTDGKRQSSEVQVRKVDTTYNTIASVNQSYIAWRLSNDMGLPSGPAQSQTVSVSEYASTPRGVEMVRETTEAFVSEAQFAGGLQIENYEGYSPSGSPNVLSHRTIREVEQLTSPQGREVTRTKTSRWMARGETSEGKTEFAALSKAFKQFVSENPSIIARLVDIYKPLVFEGTEVQIEVGRMPPPVKPPDQDVVGDEVENGIGNRPSDATPTDAYGNDDGWTKYIPEDTNWQDYVGDSTGTGEQDYLDYVPKDWEDFDTDSNDDGAEDWEDYVPQDPLDYDKDSDGDGIPDWAESTPSSWEDYDQDTDGDGEPDWAIFVPTTWQEFNRDSDNDGVPDWAPFVTGDWQTLNKDTNGDGVPDWAAFTPTSWEDFDQDSDSDGVPDWAPYVSTDWRDFNATDDQGAPLWEPYVNVGAEAFDQDSDGDGVPDWAELVPTGDDFSTEDSDYNPGG